MSKKRQYTVIDGDEERIWEVETREDGSARVHTPDGRQLEVESFSAGDHQLHLLVEGRSIDVGVLEEPSHIQVQLEGERHEIEVLNERERRMRVAGAGSAAADNPELLSPMAGKVVKIAAETGDVVDTDETLVVVEAMKMENDLKAHRPGKVTSIGVAEGEAVEIGDVLVTIEDQD